MLTLGIKKKFKLFDPEVNLLLEKMDKFNRTQNMPLVLLLTVNSSDKKCIIDTEEFVNIDPRLIFIVNYTDHPEKMKEEIYPLLLRFCSIHNELGDIFNVNNGNNEVNYDLTESNFSFYINIVCIGISGMGKSAGINALLQEYKSKEYYRFFSQAKNSVIYQVKNLPIKFIEIPGYEDQYTLEKALEILKYFEKEMKNSVHLILYYLNYSEERHFLQIEYSLMEEIANNFEYKIIYVITHSNLNRKRKKIVIDIINMSIYNIIENTPISHKIKKLEANENNVVFVNFHEDFMYDVEFFGKKELFKKIHDFLISNEDIKNFRLNPEEIEEKVKSLRKRAEEELFSDKIIGKIPLFGWALKKFVLEKKAIQKVANIYEIDIKKVEENLALQNQSFSYKKLLDIFDDYYKNETQKISSSINNAIEYFLLGSD